MTEQKEKAVTAALLFLLEENANTHELDNPLQAETANEHARSLYKTSGQPAEAEPETKPKPEHE